MFVRDVFSYSPEKMCHWKLAFVFFSVSVVGFHISSVRLCLSLRKVPHGR